MWYNCLHKFVGSMEAFSKAFLLFFLLHDWLKLNHLKSRMECGFSDIFSPHICSTVGETIDVRNYAARLGAKNVQKITFEAAEMGDRTNLPGHKPPTKPPKPKAPRTKTPRINFVTDKRFLP